MPLTRSQGSAANGAHTAFIVEDDPTMAAQLKTLVESMDHAWIHVETLEEAREAMARGGFCYVLLDMQIPAAAGGPPVVGCGETVLRDLRERHPDRTARGKHRLQIIVITSYSREPEFVTRMLKLDADDFVAKPVVRQEIVADKIREALAAAGREEHRTCGGVIPALAPLVLDGREEGRCSYVRVHGEPRELQNAKFVALVRMVVAHADAPGTWLDKSTMGIAHAPETPSRIAQALKGLLPPGHKVVESNKQRGVRLNPMVVAVADWSALEKHSEGAVRKMARERRDRG
jgi:CheY-like chemotaxis protein